MAGFNQTINFGSAEIPIQNQENLLWRFSASDEDGGERAREIDLNLCLSLGGVYAKPPPLVRSSSVSGDAAAAAEERPLLSLARSCSLPAEASEEAEAARLRDLQTVRRMAAKKRLAEKQRSSPAAEMAASATKSAALGRAISSIKAQNCRQSEGLGFGEDDWQC